LGHACYKQRSWASGHTNSKSSTTGSWPGP
jgi:hypothetical protein